jgi:hypothetical protein
MSDTVGVRPTRAHLAGRETGAKADLNFVEPSWRLQVGRAIARTFALAGVSQKEGAALLDRDPGQVARWISGVERPSFDVIFGVARLRGPLVIALAELSSDIDIVTQLSIRRVA